MIKKVQWQLVENLDRAITQNGIQNEALTMHAIDMKCEMKNRDEKGKETLWNAVVP